MPAAGEPLTDVTVFNPSEYSTVSPLDLLNAAAMGRVGFDHRLLQSLTSRPDETVLAIEAFTRTDREADRIDLSDDLYGLARHFKDERLVPFLVSALKEQPNEPPDDLVGALVTIGKPAFERLLGLASEVDEEESSGVLFVLAMLRIPDPRVLEKLYGFFEYDSSEAAFLLGIYGDPQAIPFLEKAKADSPELADDIDGALHALRSPEPQAAPESIDLWQIYPAVAPPMFPVLSDEEMLEFLSSPVEEHRQAAAASLIDEEYSQPVTDKLLDLARRDPVEKVRAASWAALGSVSEKKPIRRAIFDRLTDKSTPPVERAGALLAVASEDEPAVGVAIRELYEIPEVRGAALEAMWRSLDKRWAPQVKKHLDDPDLDLRRQALRGVGFLEIVSELGRLRKLFDDDDLREDALYAYALAAPAPKLTQQTALQLFKKIESEAGELSESEIELVEQAIDIRLMRNGIEPIFTPFEDEMEHEHEHGEECDDPTHDHGEPAPAQAASAPGRNAPCPCGSGKKYKKCHGAG